MKMNSGKSTGQKFSQPLVNELPVYNGRLKHNKLVAKHSGNLPKKPKYLK